jgi:hypothetical protein
MAAESVSKYPLSEPEALWLVVPQSNLDRSAPCRHQPVARAVGQVRSYVEKAKCSLWINSIVIEVLPLQPMHFKSSVPGITRSRSRDSILRLLFQMCSMLLTSRKATRLKFMWMLSNLRSGFYSHHQMEKKK